MPVYSFKATYPKFNNTVFIAPSCDLIGDVELGDNVSLWFNVTVRGDVNFIRIGEGTNVQDNSVIHVTTNTHPTIIGKNVTIGHNVTLHGCVLEDACLIGMGAVILDGVVVQKNSMVAAGSLVVPGTVVETGALWAGSLAKFKRSLKPDEIEYFQKSADNYIQLKDVYLQDTF